MKFIYSVLFVLSCLLVNLTLKSASADSTGVYSSAVHIDCGSDVGAVNPFAWGVGAPDKYTWWAGNKALADRIRSAHIKLVRVNPIQILIYNGRDPLASPGHPSLDGMDSILKTIFDAGAEPLFVVAGFPKGIAAPKNADGYLASPDWKEYAKFMAAVVHHYNVEHALGTGHSIKYWEMWNEPSIEGDGKFATKDAYKDFVETVGGAMKAQDPSIQLVGPAAPWSDLGADGWVAYTAKNLSNVIDILSWHNYGPGPGHDDTAALDWTNKSYEDDLLTVSSAGPLKAGITEYNISWQNGDDNYNQKYHSQLNSVYAASAIIHAIRGKAAMFCFYNLAETGKNLLGILSNTDYSPYKPYYVFSMFGNHFGNRLLETTGDNPHLESVAASRPGRRTQSIILVNKDLGKACDVTIYLDHLNAPKGSVRVVQIDSASSVPATSTVKYSGTPLHYKLEPLTIVSLEISSASSLTN